MVLYYVDKIRNLATYICFKMCLLLHPQENTVPQRENSDNKVDNLILSYLIGHYKMNTLILIVIGLKFDICRMYVQKVPYFY